MPSRTTDCRLLFGEENGLLLGGSFIPPLVIRDLRDLTRARGRREKTLSNENKNEST
jgi:hypothetical protein